MRASDFILRPLAILIACSLALSACAAGLPDIALPSHPEPKSLDEALGNLKSDAIIDLDAADAIAVKHNDVIAHACYTVLKKYVAQESGQVTADPVHGVISGYEKARVERLAVEAVVGKGAIPNDLKLGCAAILIDERNFYIRLAALISGTAVPGVGVIAPLLPK